MVVFFRIFSRVLAALVGGYLLANVAAILLSYWLPGSRADTVMTATFASFFIFTGAVLWVFSARAVWKAWLGLLVPGACCAVTIFILNPQAWL